MSNFMSKLPYFNWVHLDFKGMIPSESKLCQWLQRMKDCGFTAIVLEYEDRFPWETLPCDFRERFDRPAWDRIWQFCADLDLEVIPLIQTFGHLEWLLKHQQWTHLRCAGHLNILCPEHPEVRPLLTAWIEEVARLHPTSPFIHVGLDEVYHMGDCAACQKRSAQSSEGNRFVLLSHAAFICKAVVRTGKRPILWADMFLAYPGTEVVSALPPEAIFCDWKYAGEVGQDTDRLIADSHHDVMVASAIRPGGPYYLAGNLSLRIENVLAWHHKANIQNSGGIKAIIHTVWARSRGLSPLYGPWEVCLPGFEIAGDPDKALSPTMQAGMALLEQGLSETQHHLVEKAYLKMHEMHSEDPFEEQTLRWWELALRHYAELHVVEYYTLGTEELRNAIAYHGADPDLVREMSEGLDMLHDRIDLLEKDIRSFLEENQWSDIEEFLGGKIGSLRRSLQGCPRITL